mmetsp:Transcript_43091/g.75575  ORF Transcript_43091/g.75575 Transcript_43091/m.75575 type:complete len:186 (+) Transcript_43091:243-800(+)
MKLTLPQTWAPATRAIVIESEDRIKQFPNDSMYASAGTDELKQLRLVELKPLTLVANAKCPGLSIHYNHPDRKTELQMMKNFHGNKLTAQRFLAKAAGEPLPAKSSTPKKANNRNAKATIPTIESTLDRLENLTLTFQQEQVAVNQRQDVNQRQYDLNQEQQRWNHNTHDRLIDLERAFGLPPRN